MKKVLCIIMSFVVVTFCLSGCHTEKSSEKDTKVVEQSGVKLSQLRKELNTQRQKELSEPLKHTSEEYGVVGKEDVQDFTQSEVDEFVQLHTYKSEITLNEATEDIETLMKILKTSYGAYTYFGGDKRFGEAKEKILKRVSDACNQDKISTGEFHNIILEELSFVEDTHFMIGKKNTAFKKRNLYMEDKKRDFFKDKEGFYIVVDGEKKYLSSKDEDYLHLTVAKDGKLVYGLFAFVKEETELPKEFNLKTTDKKEYKMKISWTMIKAGETAKGKVHDSYKKDGIPVTSLSRMSMAHQDLPSTNEFIDEAKKLRDEKVFILDLRGNLGGVIDVNNFFMYNLTGSRCQFKMQSVKRYSLLNLHHEAVTFEAMGGKDIYNGFIGVNFYDQNKELVNSWFENSQDGSKVDPGETVITSQDGKWNNYDNNIIVLIDNHTYSAGEYFLFQLATVKNVIIMGMNSSGCLVTGDVNSQSNVYLPNSGLAVNYGQVLAIDDKIEGFDTDGWMPDIITRDDALDAAVALVKKNK